MFDARTLKQVYPLIVGGEILGVVAGGISSMFLPRLMGSTQDVLLVGGASMVLLLVLLLIMNREFRDDLTVSKKREPPVEAKVSLGSLVNNRYVLLVFLYQMLSAMVSPLVYYLYLNQAEVYFKTPEALTSFFGTAIAVVTVLTLLFVVFLSGKLLTRYGMGLVLAGTPVGVGVAVSDVRREALLSAGKIAHPRLLPPVIDNLKVSATRSEAMSTLVVFGEHLLPVPEESLRGKAPYDKETVVRLIRACSMSRSDEAVAFLEKLIAHRDDDIQWAVLKGLNLCGYRASEERREEVERAASRPKWAWPSSTWT